jgi:NAD(P)-dependent dehydrogenase (short-subunit alcohol dehydrogenase family)
MSEVTGSGLLAGKVVLIAGVGPQMGSATARIAAREGASVALIARSTEAVEKTADIIREKGGSVLPMSCDLADQEQMRNAVNTAVSEFGRIDGVFYNAAFYDHRHDSLELDYATWDMTMAINLMSPLALARLTLPVMLKNGGGAFVFNSSGASLAAEDTRLGYGVSKAGLNSLTRFIANKYGDQGIRANAVIPSVVWGELADAVTRLTCLRRSGRAREIGEVVTFLLSDRASILTGQVIHLDGGMFEKAHWPSMTPEQFD